MTNDERRANVASRLRDIGHDFVARDLSDEQLDELLALLAELTRISQSAVRRERDLTNVDVSTFKMVVPNVDDVTRHQLFADSFVSGNANPLGLGASLRRDGDVAVMNVTLGKAFEGAPGRAHGGVVAALVDETMGLVLAIHGRLAFTAQLDITYLAPTPIDEPLSARAWLAHGSHRKLFIEASVTAGGVDVVTAKALFIAVDPSKFLEHLIEES
ncbi:MAG TPA: PaaI family thioesterase [Acidimicrobiales bacterium]|nr:PaaI family thioesterase [Acidimicrobiales bacterium]